MEEALKEAFKAKEKDEVPIGCVIVKDDKIIARAHNLCKSNNNSYSHAELLAIKKAMKKLDETYLVDCDLYVTLEPCMMCAGAISLARINHLYYGTKDSKGGMVDSNIKMKEIKHVGSYPRTVESGLCEAKCANILSTFFKDKRQKKL